MTATRECVVCGQPLTPEGKCPRPQETLCTVTDEGPERHAAIARRSTHVWTLDEILAAPESGDWFFGVVRHEGRWAVGEIFLGLGFCPSLPYPWWHPRSWWWLVQDVRSTRRRKEALSNA